MFIRSERLFLRPGWPEDWNEIFAKIADEAIVKNLVLAAWPYIDGSVPAFAVQGQDERCPHFLITVPTGEGARLIGCAGLARSEEGVELGYWIERDQWRCGYATEAARAVLSLARALGHRRIVACNFMDNPASGRVLEKVGFCPTGEIRQRFCIARGEFAPAMLHAVDLGVRSNCDGDQADAMRVA